MQPDAMILVFLISSFSLTRILMRVKEQSERAGLKRKDHGIWPHDFVASRRGKGGSSDRFPLLRLTVHGDCNHEIRRWLHLGRKAMTNLDRVLKSRDVTLLIKVSIVKPMVFPVVTYVCKSWTVKKAECQKIDAFRLWCC